MKPCLFLLSFLFLIPIYYILFPTPALAQGSPWTGRCVSTIDASVPTIQGFECLFANLLKVVVTVAGLAFLCMFIVGGFQYMQSNNDPKAVAGANSTLTYALIGLVGAILSWLIVLFIQQFTGVNVTDFRIP